jgi:RNA polymerase sigma-70 factor (ECF subfamily)
MADAGDADLLRAARDGDRAAFEALVARHWRRLFRMARGVLHNDADAEDAAQEAWVKIWQSLDTFRGESAPTTWMGSIAVRTAIDRLRARDRAGAESIEFHAPVLSDPGRSPAARADDALFAAAVARAREVLSPQQRAVFDLRAREELEFDEIGAIVGCGTSSARQHWFRAVRRMRKALAAWA